MSNVTSIHGPRPVATAPSSASYRTQPGRLVTFAGQVRAAAVEASRAETSRPAAAKRAA